MIARLAFALAAVALSIGVLSASGGAPATESATAASLQRQAVSVRPDPAVAKRDRGKLYADGCMIDQSEFRFPTCVYGKRSSRKTVVLFGDSQAMHWFPALLRLARANGWRLIGRVRQGCVPAAVRFSRRCDRWRAETLRRIERRDRPDVVVIGTGVAYRVIAGGRRLSSRASQSRLRRGYARTLRRLRRTGARVAVMKTLTWAPKGVVGCVRRSLRRLRRCAFSRRQPTNRVFDARAARAVRGAKLIDARSRICLPRICPAVTGNILIYRDPYHLSATYARTLSTWLGRRMPLPR